MGQLIGCSQWCDGLTVTLRYILRQSGFWHRAVWYIDMAYLPDYTWQQVFRRWTQCYKDVCDRMDNKLRMCSWLHLGPLARNQSKNCSGF